jgi:PIN domain nuclease of toxin-antitoxin system
MKIIADTHVFLWALAEPERISRPHISELESLANTIYVSSVSVAEIMIKASLGKLSFNLDPVICITDLGFEPLAFSASDAALLRELPFHHRDPFDRMLISQSLALGMKIMTYDKKFRQYECQLM